MSMRRRWISAKQPFRDDGSECFRQTMVNASLVAPLVYIQVPKPGIAQSLTVSILAAGERAFNGSYSTQVSLKRRDSLIWMPASSGRVFGQSLEWEAEDGASTHVDLDADAGRYSIQLGRQLKIKVDCSHQQGECAADGDTIETLVEFADNSNKAVRSSVLIRAEVQAVPSCTLSNVTVSRSSTALPHDLAVFQVKVMLRDVDGISIKKTPPELLMLRWSSSHGRVELNLDRELEGSSIFQGVIQQSARQLAGQYELIVMLKGVNRSDPESDAMQTRIAVCELLRRNVTVECSTGFQQLPSGGCTFTLPQQAMGISMVLGATLGGLCSLVMVAVAVHLYRHRKDRETAKRLLLSLVNSEVKLVLLTFFEIWDVAGKYDFVS